MLAPIPGVVYRVAQEKPPPADSLAAAWPKVHWSVPDRGPLLLIGGGALRLQEKDSPHFDPFWHRRGNPSEQEDEEPLDPDENPKPKPAPAPKGGYNLAILLPDFGCELLRFPSVNVIVPSKVYTFSLPRPYPEAQIIEQFLGGDDSSSRQEPALLALVNSLTPGQWQQAGSETGVPMTSMSPSQQKLFEAGLSRSLSFVFFPGATPPWSENEPFPVLPKSQQRELRLQLQRSLADLPNLGRPVTPPITREVTLRPPTDTDAVEDLLSGYPLLPNRPRPSDLALTDPSLAVRISLLDVKTIRGLVERIAAATGLPLLADARIASLSVMARGTSASASDLVIALCRALGGTVRRVTEGKESVYFLTDERLTEAERLALSSLPETKMLVSLMERMRTFDSEEAEGRRKLSEQAAFELLPRGRGTEFPEALWKNPAQGLLFSELPQALQGQLTKIAHDEETPLPTKIRGRSTLDVSVYSPTLKATAFLTAFLRRKPVAPRPLLTLPTSLPNRVLLATLPKDPTSAPVLILRMQAFGFTELRVPVRPEDDTNNALSSLAEAAKKAGLGFVPVIEALAATRPDQPRDRSILGETYIDWRKSLGTTLALQGDTPVDFTTPEAADVQAIAARVKRLASRTGVTGIGLTSLAAPGYRASPNDDELDGFEHNSELGSSVYWRAAAVPGERLAFLRTHRRDPLDLEAQRNGEDEAITAWNALQAKRRDAFLTRLTAALKAEGITVPLSAQAPTHSQNWSRWTGHLPDGKASLVGLARISYTESEMTAKAMGNAVYAMLGEPEPFRRDLRPLLSRLQNPESEDENSPPAFWGGILLDFAPLPLDEALIALERTLVAKKPFP